MPSLDKGGSRFLPDFRLKRREPWVPGRRVGPEGDPSGGGAEGLEGGTGRDALIRFAIQSAIYLLVIVLVQPSVTLLGLNLKVLSTGLLAVVFLLIPLYRGGLDLRRIRPFLARSVLLALILLFFLVLGLLDGFSLGSVMSQTKAILNAYLVYAILRITVTLGFLAPRDIARAVVIGAVIFFTAKVVILARLLSGSLDIVLLAEQMKAMLGPDVVPPVAFGDSLIRIQLPNEIIGVFALAILLFSPGQLFKSRILTFLAGVFIALGVASTMSRFMGLWIAALLAYKLLEDLVVKRNVLLFSLVVLVGAVLCVVYWQELSSTVLLRFTASHEESQIGDSIRHAQVLALGNEFLHHPLFGVGIGGYCPTYIRNEFNPWMYEAQLLALLLQVGLAGMAALTLVTMRIRLRGRPWRKALNYGWALMFLGWGISCLSNPYLMSSLTGIMFWLCKENLGRTA